MSTSIQTEQGWLHTHPHVFYRAWRTPQAPTAAPTAVVIICHGYAEHSGRYHHVGRQLATQNLAVYACDLHGHGHSSGIRASATNLEGYVDNLIKMLRHAQQSHPDVPLVLLGHSMGGLVALQTCLENPDDINLLCLSGAMLRNAVKLPGWLNIIAKTLAQTRPDLPTQALDARDIARDPYVVARYLHDPLVYTSKVRAGLGYCLLTAGEDILQRAPALTLPMLIMHADADRIADARGSEELYKRVSSSDKTLKLFDSYHEILNDTAKDAVLQTLSQWLDDRLA
ncbi:MAG: lysophospholipase [Deinococcota bacterium]